MSESEINKSSARAFAERFTLGDWDGLAELLTEDFRWVVPAAKTIQSPSLKSASATPLEASRSKAEALEVFRHTCLGCVDGKFTITINSLMAEDDRVAAEAESHAVSAANGRAYNNKYAYIFTFRDGKISEFREYQDTLHSFDVWIAA